MNTASVGLVHDPSRPLDHKTMYQITTGSIGCAPPPPYVLKLFSSISQKPIYIPQNGQRSTPTLMSDTKEEMMEIFVREDGVGIREAKSLMGKRNFAVFVGFDQEAVHVTAGSQGVHGNMYDGSAGSVDSGGQDVMRTLSLAVNYFVQVEGSFGTCSKYGPVIIPCLDFGR